MTRDEAIDFISKIPYVNADVFECKNPHSLEKYYQMSLETHDCIELIRIIKIVYEKHCKAQKSGKKLAQIDEKYMRKAENILYEELAAALDIQKDNVPKYIQVAISDLNNDLTEAENG